MVDRERIELSISGCKPDVFLLALTAHKTWLGIMDSNHCMAESKSAALPTWLIPNNCGTWEKNWTSVYRLSADCSTIELPGYKLVIYKAHWSTMCFINCSGLPTTAYFTGTVTASLFIQDSAHLSMFNVGCRFSLPIPRTTKTKTPGFLILGSWLKIYGLCIWSNQDPLMVRDRL